MSWRLKTQVILMPCCRKKIRYRQQELREAFELYQQIIDAVRTGHEDPEQLSLASLGQQGRIKHWQSDPVAAAHLYATPPTF